jgi:DNA repair protein RadC
MNIAIETIEFPIPVKSKTHQIYYERYVDFKIVCRPTKISVSKLTKITDAVTAYEYLAGIFDPEQLYVKEYFYVLALNRNSRLIGIMRLSEGGINGTVADIRLILHFLVSVLAGGAILCHNHPSGNLLPSEPDKILTRRCMDILGYCDIHLVDHIIIGGANFYSMQENGML